MGSVSLEVDLTCGDVTGRGRTFAEYEDYGGGGSGGGGGGGGGGGR